MDSHYHKLGERRIGGKGVRCVWRCDVIEGMGDKGMLMLCRLGVLIMYKDVCDNGTFIDVIIMSMCGIAM